MIKVCKIAQKGICWLLLLRRTYLTLSPKPEPICSLWGSIGANEQPGVARRQESRSIWVDELSALSHLVSRLTTRDGDSADVASISRLGAGRTESTSAASVLHPRRHRGRLRPQGERGPEFERALSVRASQPASKVLRSQKYKSRDPKSGM